MPELGLGTQRLDPDLPFAHRLLRRLGGVIAAHLLKVVGVERAVHDAAVFTFGAFGLDWAGVAGRGPGTVDDHLFTVLGRFPLRRMLLRTAIFVPLRVVREVGLREERWSP